MKEVYGWQGVSKNEEEKINRMEVCESLIRKDLYEKLNFYKKVYGGQCLEIKQGFFWVYFLWDIDDLR